MEAIGGTGDIITGIAAALIGAGWEIDKGAVVAAWASRLSGHYSRPSPATQVVEVINNISLALGDLL
jgi:NAD(P)H-hydrate repair Nnr-like enzyme with NAD(P)H-hydrate dehydratase domain